MVMKCKMVIDRDGKFYGIRLNCPGCALIQGEGNGAKVLPVRWLPPGQSESSQAANCPHWDFNGNFDKPVFSPSVLSHQTMHEPPVTSENIDSWYRHPWKQHPVDHICHSFIGCNGAQPGQIIFLSDCTHALAGKTMDLPELYED
jgi:hypothetical protein